MSQRVEQILHKDTLIANEYTKNSLIPLAIMEMKIKTTLRFHYTYVRMVKMKKTQYQMLARMQTTRILPADEM